MKLIDNLKTFDTYYTNFQIYTLSNSQIKKYHGK